MFVNERERRIKMKKMYSDSTKTDSAIYFFNACNHENEKRSLPEDDFHDICSKNDNPRVSKTKKKSLLHFLNKISHFSFLFFSKRCKR